MNMASPSNCSDFVPIIDICPLVKNSSDSHELQTVAAQIRAACCEHGFFYISNHGVPAELISQLEKVSHEFFALPTEEKMRIRMELGGKAWRGFFPLGDELTSGRPDWKEGIYFGSELDSQHELVQRGIALHGANQFPERPAELKAAVLEYIDRVTQLGHYVMRGLAMSLNLPDDYFSTRYTHDPLILFRIFNYPSLPLTPELLSESQNIWGVGEHTDYGLLTLLFQDTVGGLQVKSRSGQWIQAPPVPGTFVCNIGDMLDRMTGGLYRSTPHRVSRNTSGRHRLSFPLFFDPNFFCHVKKFDDIVDATLGASVDDDSASRWDKANVHAFHGTYGDYVLNKVGKVFPQLMDSVKDL